MMKIPKQRRKYKKESNKEVEGYKCRENNAIMIGNRVKCGGTNLGIIRKR
jgi:hypothetical protein